MPRCAIAYSGRGRLAAAIAEFFLARQSPVIGLVDRPSANRQALEALGVPVYTIRNTAEDWLHLCEREGIECIALAGYLSLVPAEVVRRYAGRLLNSHPALLPAFGGKGLYGRHVHAAVVAAGCAESGLTIHLVDENYDTGPILYQVRLPIAGLSVEEVEAFIQAVERAVYPAFVWRFCQSLRLTRSQNAPNSQAISP
ncbi:MAG: formyltransferase family protein [Bacteroidia bacterium]